MVKALLQSSKPNRSSYLDPQLSIRHSAMRLTPLGSVEGVWHSWCIWRQKCRKIVCHPHKLVLCHPIRMSKPFYELFLQCATASFSSGVRILGQKPDKSLKSFPSCYSQQLLQLCLEISIASNSRNLLQFLQFRWYTLYRRQEENLIEYHPNGLINQHRNLKIMTRNLNQIVISWIRLQASVLMKNEELQYGPWILLYPVYLFYLFIYLFIYLLFIYEERRYTLISYHVLGDKIV